MSKLTNSLLAFAASAMMFSCSSDEPGNNGNKPAEGDFYATLSLSLPTGGRSETNTPDSADYGTSEFGTEIGKDNENNVGSVYVVIASANTNDGYDFITGNLSDAQATGTSKTKYNVQFETQALNNNAGEKVAVFAFCNPTTEMVDYFKTLAAGTDFADKTGNVKTGASIWTMNGFLMTNATITEVELPSADALKNTYNTPTNPFPLGTVKVERTAARFDFKQTTVEGQSVANQYPIYSNKVGDDNAKELVAYVKINGMALHTQANEYYWLRRVSADGQDANVTVCGVETPLNYVVSPNASSKTSVPTSEFIINNYTLTGLSGTNAEYFDFTEFTYDPIGTNVNGDANPDNWTPGADHVAIDKTGYYIWKYTTENTIPDVDNQRKGISTGVMFRAELVAADETSALSAVINAGKNVIYAQNGVLFGDLDMLKKYVLNNPVSVAAETFKATFGLEEITNTTLETVTEDPAQTIENGFALYRPTDGKYLMYYPYYNRHNDNYDNMAMGPMEFATVRNNVYKLAVSNVLEFGHPGKPGDDPDPENPDNPDETPKTYFRVDVVVLPWVVRVNNIIL